MSKPTFFIITSLLALLVLLPLLTLFSHIIFGSYDIWKHLAETVLIDYLIHSILLCIGVSIGVFSIAVPTAWLVSIYHFPLRRFFTWALLLPFAMPAYIIAYTYTGLLDFTGPIHTLIRTLIGWQYGDYWFFEIRSITGAIIMLTLVLYPYVYLLARTAFINQSGNILEMGHNLGNTRSQNLWRIALPLARPAIIAGMSLAIMETLADYGTVKYFGISTFTTGIFRAFYGFGSISAAAQLASMLFFFIMALFFIKRHSRKQTRYFQISGKTTKRIQLTGKKKWLACVICGLPLLFGFIVPVLQLSYWALYQAAGNHDFYQLAWNSFSLASIAAFIILCSGALLAYAKRFIKHPIFTAITSIATMGYAIPGTVIAVGILISLSWMDHQLINIIKLRFNKDISLAFSGTILALLFAYLVRFLTVSMNTIESGLQKISPSLDAAGHLMGYSTIEIGSKIHLPLLKSSLLTSFLIVFIDVLKELPATLILRPFDFNTLAIKAFELASDERLADAAPASLTIVLIGLIPVIFLSHFINKTTNTVLE